MKRAWVFITGNTLPVIHMDKAYLVDKFGIRYRANSVLFTIATPENIFYSARVISCNGRVVNSSNEQKLAIGTHTIAMPASLAAGMYVCELTIRKSSGVSSVRKSLVVTH